MTKTPHTTWHLAPDDHFSLQLHASDLCKAIIYRFSQSQKRSSHLCILNLRQTIDFKPLQRHPQI